MLMISPKQLRCVWLVLLLSTSVWAQSGRRTSGPTVNPARDREQNVLRIPTIEVQLTVTVRDSLGQAVANLQASDFLIYDDGKRYESAHCAYRYVPANVVLLLDLSSSWPTDLEALYQAVQAFRRALAPTDRLAVLQFTDELILTQDWGNQEITLRNALRPALRSQGKAALTDALTLAATKMTETTGQRVILLFTSGLNTAGLTDFTQAQLAVQSAGATVYIFSETEALAAALRQPGQRRPPFQNEEKVLARLALAEAELTSLAEASGGNIYFPVQRRSLSRMLAETANDLRGQYWLTYLLDEDEGGLGRLHKIQVLTRAGHQTYTRASTSLPTSQQLKLNYKLNKAMNLFPLAQR